MKIILTLTDIDSTHTDGVIEVLPTGTTYDEAEIVETIIRHLKALQDQMGDFDIGTIRKIIITDEIINLVSKSRDSCHEK